MGTGGLEEPRAAARSHNAGGVSASMLEASTDGGLAPSEWSECGLGQSIRIPAQASPAISMVRPFFT